MKNSKESKNQANQQSRVKADLRHLIIGASGQVGQALLKTIHNKNEEVIGTYNNTSLYSKFTNEIPNGKLFKLDINDSKSIEKLIIEINPDVIYITAANTNVDYCELNIDESYKTNYLSITNIVSAINNIKIKCNRKKEPLLIFYSTDYVFDGEKGLYSESDIPNPINIYGKHKLLAEQYLKENAQHYIIIRTNGVFSGGNTNFVGRLVQNLKKNNIAEISDDEFGTPTYALDLADATVRVVENVGCGLRNSKNAIVNLVGRDYVSRYDFALNIALIFNCDSNLIKPIKSISLSRAAKRPLLGGLNIDLAENLIGRKMMNYIDGLKQCLHLKTL